jgi:hypothetical protein
MTTDFVATPPRERARTELASLLDVEVAALDDQVSLRDSLHWTA